MVPFKLRLLNNRSLRQKILIPFFLILVLLGIGATVVSVLLITRALSDTADERLNAFQEIIFREIKKQEVLLETFSELLPDTRVSTMVLPKGQGTMPDRLYTSLKEANISIAFYSKESRRSVSSEPLNALLSQAIRSGQSSLRLISDKDRFPRLTVASALHPGANNEDIVVLETVIDDSFLKELIAPFNTRAVILSRSGEILSASEQGFHPIALTREEIAQVISGRKIFRTDPGLRPHRHLFTAVPLGTTDLVILALELPMADAWYLTRSLTTGAVLAISLALVLGGYIYYRLIRQIMAPVRELTTATRSVGEGNLDYRIRNISNDELGQMAISFNDMMAELEKLYSEKIVHEKEMALAQEALTHKEIIEKKNREIERANRELKVHLKEVSALFQLNQAMISTLELNPLFDRILQVLKDVLNCGEMVLLLYNPGEEQLVVRKAVGSDTENVNDLTFNLSEGITGSAARSQRLLYVRDVSSDERSLGYKGRAPLAGSMVSAPLVVKNNLVGVLNLHKEKTSAFADTEISLIQAVANQAAIAIENARLYEKTRNLSNTDDLTGLANRRHFKEIFKREAAHARRFLSPLSLVMADIDHFKEFNDTHGHLVGDTVLKKVSEIFLQNTRGIDLVGRFGGEEFIILLPGTTKEGAREAAEKLRNGVTGQIFAGTNESQPGGGITLSFGVAEFPSDSKDIYELLELADRALYLAKEAGRNQTVVWNPGAKPENNAG